jgi:hypothetical protein
VTWPAMFAGLVHPSINPVGFRMADQLKDLHNSLPDSLALKYFLDWYALNTGGFHAVNIADDVSKFVQVAHSGAGALNINCSSTFRPTCHSRIVARMLTVQSTIVQPACASRQMAKEQFKQAAQKDIYR